MYAHCHISTRQRLQRVQNRAARLVLSAPPLSSSLPLLQQLHWLPIEVRVSHKLCCLTYRVVHGAAPSYLTELCEPCLDTRHRSTSRDDFIISCFNRHLAHSLWLHPLLGTSYLQTFVTVQPLQHFQLNLSPFVHCIIFSLTMFIMLYVVASELWLLGAIVSLGD